MNPSRRKALKQLLAGVGASLSATSLTTFSAAVTAATEDPSNSAPAFYSEDEFALISRVCDLTIPDTDTPGAVRAGVPQYLDVLFSEWANAGTQASERDFLKALQKGLTDNDIPFIHLPDERAYQVLTDFDRKAFASSDSNRLASAYRQFKQRMTQAYFSSEKGALLELEWLATPGKWIPSLPLPEIPG